MTNWYCPMCDTQSLDKWVCKCKAKEPFMSKVENKLAEQRAKSEADYYDPKMQPDSVGKKYTELAVGHDKVWNTAIELYNTTIWNAAIEAAALSVHTSKDYPTQYSDTIRKLKK